MSADGTASRQADIAEIERALSIYHHPDSDDCFEIRALGVQRCGTVSGVFHASEIIQAAKAAAGLSGLADAVYFIPNAVSAVCRARAPGYVIKYARNTTTDAEIARRLWLLIDSDAGRPAGISSTDKEHEAAIERAATIATDLGLSHGFPSPLRADSGNGGHLSYRVDLPNDKVTTELFRRFLQALSRRYSDASGKIDASVFNAARIWKSPGTMACQGADMPDRPHRMARLIDVPKALEIVKVGNLVTPEMMESVIAAFMPKVQTPPRRSGRNGSKKQPIGWADVQPYLADRITKEKRGSAGATIFEIRGCPFDPNDHSDDTAGSITVFGDDGIAPSCRHDHCQGKGFKEFLSAYAPHLLDSLGKSGKKKRQLKETLATIEKLVGSDDEDNDEAEHDGERRCIIADQFKEIQESITNANGWRAAVVAALLTQQAYRNRFARDEGEKLYVYHRGVYRPKGEERIRKLAKRIVDAEKWSRHLAEETVEYIRVDSAYLWEQPLLNTLNLENGLLDLNTHELKPHLPDHLSQVQLPVRYDPKATCLAWEEQIVPNFPDDAGRAGVVWEIVAWLMTPWTAIQKALLLIGPGGSGKSTFLTALSNFLGGRRNVSSLSLQKLVNDRFAAAGLFGKLANICADLPSTHLESSDVFKKITGGDSLTAEYKFKDLFDFVPFARLVFSANQPPVSKDAEDAFFERWYVLPFEHVYRGTDREIDRTVLDNRLAAPNELSGVLNHALAVLSEVRRRGLTVVPSMKTAHDDFRRATDPLSIWLAQNTVEDRSVHVPKRDLIAAFNAALTQQGRPVMSDKAFGLALKRLRKNVTDGQRTVGRRANVWCYLGIGLKASDNEREREFNYRGDERGPRD